MAFGFDHSGSNDPHRAKKKYAIIGVASVMLVAMVVAIAVGLNTGSNAKPSSNTEGNHGTSVVSKSIKAICQPTDYRETCENALTKAAGNTTDPQKLVQVGFQVAIDSLHEAINNSNTVKELAKDPMAKQALDICYELIDDSIHDLKRSFNHLGGFDYTKFDKYLANLKTWLTATITYQQTCLDGFQNTTGQAGEKMKEILTMSTMLTNNGLAMVTGLSSILSDLNIPGINRKLLQVGQNNNQGFPSWASAGQRRLLATTIDTITPNMTVAKDGSGDYTTINDAVANIPKKRVGYFVVYIKEGVYEEQVVLPRKMNYIVFVGDGPTKTKVTGNLSYANGVQTFKTSTVTINGDNFIAKDMGFENSAGAIGHQAVALRVQADMSIFYNCRMDGYQDTLYAHANRQFYRDCTITGTIDFIFGNAAAIFQNCQMIVRKPLPNQRCIVTAQGRNSTKEETGTILQNCTISADPDYYPVRFTNNAYLGRPWREYSKTIVMESNIDDLIDTEGWLPWMGSFGLDTLYYGEYNNRGAGSAMDKRVTWNGIKKITPEIAESYTAAKFIGGDDWVPPVGVPYASGFMNV